MRNAKEGVVTVKGIKFPVVFGNPDIPRLIDCFKNIAFGLYFHEHNAVFKGEVITLMGFLNYEDENRNTLVRFIRERFTLEELVLEEKGANPKVFKYQFCSPDNLGLISLKLTFYGGTEVFIAFKPDGVKSPYSLSMDLIDHGIKTIHKLNDKEFIFNHNI